MVNEIPPRDASRSPWRYVHLIFALLFAISTALQWNDPDPIRWMALYGSATVLAVLAFRGVRPTAAYAIVIIVCLVWMVSLRMGVEEFVAHHDPGAIARTMKADKPWIEETREFGGLGIVMTYCAVLLLVGLARRRSRPSDR
jgi:Transmembrane family 220, helix